MALLAFAAVTAACGGSSGQSPSAPSPTAPTPSPLPALTTGPSCPRGTTASSGSMAATLDGASWTAVCAAVSGSGAAFALSAADNAADLANARTISLVVPSATGNYQIGSSFGLVNAAAAALVIGGSVWQATSAGGSGTIAVTTLTTHNAVGSFSFNLTASSGSASGTRSVAAGTFNINY